MGMQPLLQQQEQVMFGLIVQQPQQLPEQQRNYLLQQRMVIMQLF
jgi:hypothetical protein